MNWLTNILLMFIVVLLICVNINISSVHTLLENDGVDRTYVINVTYDNEMLPGSNTFIYDDTENMMIEF